MFSLYSTFMLKRRFPYTSCYIRTITTLATESAIAIKQTKQEYDIVIVGSGIVGAAMACALGKAPHLRHLNIALADASNLQANPTQEWSNRVVALGSSSIQVLQSLDVWDHIPEKFKYPYQNMKVFDGSSDSKVTFHAADYGLSSLGYIVDVPTLRSTLLSSLRSTPIHLLPSTELHTLTYPTTSVSSLNSHLNGYLELHMTQDLRLSTPLLIGADGIHSKVALLSHIEYTGHAYDQMGVVATVYLDTMINETAWQRFLTSVGGPIALLPISDTQASLVWTLPTHLAKKVFRLNANDFVALLNAALAYSPNEVSILLNSLSQLKLTDEIAWRDTVYEERPGFDFSQMPPQVLDLVPNSRAMFPLTLKHAKKYTGQRTVLVGDAAHVIHPLAGQGLNLGLADVASLTRTLDTASSLGQDVGDSFVLSKYTKDRYWQNTLMLTLCDSFQWIFGTNMIAPFEWVRSYGVRQVQSSSLLKQLGVQCVSKWNPKLTETPI